MKSESTDFKLNICKTVYIVLPMTQTCINMKSVDYTDILVLLSTSELVSSKLLSFPWIIIPLIWFLCTVYLSSRTEKQLYQIYQWKKSEVRGKPLRIISFATLSQSQFSQSMQFFYILWPNCHFFFYFPCDFEALLGLQVFRTGGSLRPVNAKFVWIVNFVQKEVYQDLKNF